MIKLITILGPTGVGKTGLGIGLAEEFNGEIVNADSRQVYRDMDIGTAKPSAEQLASLPHYLINIREINEPWNAALFAQSADAAIQDIASRKKNVFVVGGTGLHIRALLFGLFEGVGNSPEIRALLEERREEEGLGSLYLELKKVDPQAALKINPNDPVRIIRALEVFYLTKRPISSHQEGHGFQKSRYEYLKIGLNVERTKLIENLDKRIGSMITAGLEAEVRGLVEKWGEQTLLQRAIGYTEWFPYFRGACSKDEVVERIKISTRQFAKRQMSWFRKEKDIVWMEPSDTRDIRRKISDFLA